jgi:CRISPR-associated endonuclease Csn1
LTCCKTDVEIQTELEKAGIENHIIDAVFEVSFDQFIRLSIKALKKILPFMEKGLRYDEAVAQVPEYLHHSQRALNGEKSRYLPLLNKEEIVNPVVYRALNQARKLVNAIIKKYGSPSAIHIELARDLSKSLDERKAIKKEQQGFLDERQLIVAEFEENFHRKPNGLDLLKYRLYKQQDGKCGYSLKAIDHLEEIFTPAYQVDHALPYSRSYDNSMNNQVLVLTAENQNKGDLTPYEYLDGAHESERWKLFKAFVESNKKIRKEKRDRLLRQDFSGAAAEGFRERNLSDTRYICRSFKNHIEKYLQFNPGTTEEDVSKKVPQHFSKQCVVVTGRLTAFLRGRWGLAKIREEGDLHHALDAAVVAACNRRMIKRLSDYSRRNELKYIQDSKAKSYIDPETGEVLDVKALQLSEKLDAQFPQPWDGFRDELKARMSDNPAAALEKVSHYTEAERQAVKPIRVSRMPTRRGLGEAHGATIRSKKFMFDDDHQWLENPCSSVKKPLTELKLKDIENIVGYGDRRNTALIEKIRQRLEAHNDDGKAAFREPLYKPGVEGKNAPCVRTVKIKTVQKSGIPVRGGWADNATMLRADIFTKKGKFYAVPVYVSDVVSKVLPSKAITAAKPKSEWPMMDESYTFLFSLYKNDWVKVCDKKAVREGYYSGLHSGTANISLRVHDRNTKIGEKGEIKGIGIKTAISVEKYQVDLLGNLYKSPLEIRKPLRPGQLVYAEILNNSTNVNTAADLDISNTITELVEVEA